MARLGQILSALPDVQAVERRLEHLVAGLGVERGVKAVVVDGRTIGPKSRRRMRVGRQQLQRALVTDLLAPDPRPSDKKALFSAVFSAAFAGVFGGVFGGVTRHPGGGRGSI